MDHDGDGDLSSSPLALSLRLSEKYQKSVSIPAFARLTIQSRNVGFKENKKKETEIANRIDMEDIFSNHISHKISSF